MTDVDRWLLPDGVDEILPPQASRLETLRRELLDLYASWGYELVIPPLIEFLESLSIVPSTQLQLRTFKIVDQLTGRTMGVRADLTSQAARIDAHGLQRPGPTRLCYADSVLHTKPSSLTASRCPIRIGAELYGHAGTDSDVEVISLMLETLRAAGLETLQLALGHVGIYRSIIDNAGLDRELEQSIFEASQRKSGSEIAALLKQANTNGKLLRMLQALPSLSGGIEVLDRAEAELSDAPGSTLDDIRELRGIAAALARRYPEQSLYFDLSELRGYEYHTGVVFAAYIPGFGEAVAKGGRYDHIGEVFGRKRPATGFDADLKTLLALGGRNYAEPDKIFAPAGDDPELLSCIARLRGEGRQVVVELEGQRESAREMGCGSRLVHVNGEWRVEPA